MNLHEQNQHASSPAEAWQVIRPIKNYFVRMKNKYILIGLFYALILQLLAQIQSSDIPRMPNPAALNATMEREWTALQQLPPGLGVREGLMFLLDVLDARFLKPKQIDWVLKVVRGLHPRLFRLRHFAARLKK
jgi:hypothetical protein